MGLDLRHFRHSWHSITACIVRAISMLTVTARVKMELKLPAAISSVPSILKDALFMLISREPASTYGEFVRSWIQLAWFSSEWVKDVRDSKG